MLRFCGFDLELWVDKVLDRSRDEPVVCSATDFTGQHWLIVEAEHEPRRMTWICAPASTRMVDLVAAGSATPFDAVHHSQTGWVELVSTIEGHSVPDRRIRCSDLPAGAGSPIAA